MAETANTSREDTSWRGCAAMLLDILNGARADDQDRDTMITAIAYDLIRSEEQEKACPTCGKPKHDFSYWRVTGAGRMLVAALREAARQSRQGNDGGSHV